MHTRRPRMVKTLIQPCGMGKTQVFNADEFIEGTEILVTLTMPPGTLPTTKIRFAQPPWPRARG